MKLDRGGLIVSEYVPLGSTVQNANPAYEYYRQKTGEIAWLFMAQSGVAGQTITYQFVPQGTNASVGGTVYYMQGTASRSITIAGQQSSVNVSLGGVRGVVRNAQMTGCLVSVAGKTVTSNTSGKYEIYSIPTGTQTLAAKLAGGEFYLSLITTGCKSRFSVSMRAGKKSE